MTKDQAISQVISLAYEQVGYREGPNNYNKYAEDPDVCQAIGWNVQNQPWCATFVVWLHINSFGYDLGQEVMYGCSASCSVQAGYYQSHGAFYYGDPQRGDQIFFYADGGINHTGIVVDISGSTITTVEGNYSDSVCQNTYFVGDSHIAGYGRPDWELAEEQDPLDPDERVYPILKYGDGLNAPKKVVKAWQSLLLAWGYDLGRGGADGEFGSMTLTATNKFQKEVGITADGVVGEETWKEAIFMPSTYARR